MPNPNIIQAEFFHVGGKGLSLEEVFAECRERTADSRELSQAGIENDPHIKTVIRFFDKEGILTQAVIEAEEMRKHDEELSNHVSRSWGPVRWLLGMWLHLIERKIAVIDNDLRVATTLGCATIILSKETVAVEKFDHSFRVVRPEERYDLLQSVCASTSVWVFVFEPNDMLADKNEMIACFI